jgi:hypothetical protein
MNPLLPLIYFTAFATIAGASFALMWRNIKDLNTPRTPRHPEAPKEGEEVLYVDLTKERLEELYKN